MTLKIEIRVTPQLIEAVKRRNHVLYSPDHPVSEFSADFAKACTDICYELLSFELEKQIINAALPASKSN